MPDSPSMPASTANTGAEPSANQARPVPEPMRASLALYGEIMNRVAADGVFWRCARAEMRVTAMLLALRLFGVMVEEAEALERVRFSVGFETCWLADKSKANDADQSNT